MLTIDLLLYLIAIILFIVAGIPVNKAGWQFEWIAAAALVLTLVV